MWVFTGLGNPGREFLFNRHNIGFMVIDYACTQLNIANKVLAHQALIMHTKIENNTIMMVKPLTYMNSSGEALKQISAAFQISPQEFIILHDDLYLPLGTIKIKSRGGSAGHNGVDSIISNLQTNCIPRIKLGIKEEEPVKAENYSEYVLSDFRKSDMGTVHEMLKQAYDAMVCISVHGIHACMNKFNKKK